MSRRTLLQDTLAAAKAHADTLRARRRMLHSGTRTRSVRSLHASQQSAPALLLSSPENAPVTPNGQRHVYARKKLANTAGQQHIARRSLSASARAARENKTQAQFIQRPSEANGNTLKPATSTSAESPRDSDQKGPDNAISTGNSQSPSQAEKPKPPKRQDKPPANGSSHLQYLTEEVVQSTDENSKTPTKDEINTLLSYPTLFDPIRKPRHPIVLCHGLYGFDTWGLELLPALKVHYWADVLHVLKGIVGVDPIVVGVPGTGAITERAKQLHNVLRNDAKLRGKEINMIGHSMGGLDCRHLLANIRPTEYHPVSLTTLATPHRGSPFMAWCRANIGIGDIARAAEEASKEFSSSSSSSSTSKMSEMSLPYSLKTPIFSRSKWQQDQRNKEDSNKSRADLEALEQTKEAARQAIKDASSAMEDSKKHSSKKSKTEAITKTVINLPGLNYSLGTSLASYLLDLLDSPAYSNLTSDYLESTFNPNTPNRDDVRYFSVAARCKKLPITHPLWLPKLIVDKAQELERSKAQQTGREEPDDWQWGNDGLVPVESARWGEFLGVLDNVDHWSIRGGAGFTTEPKTKKSTSTAPSTTTPATERKSVVGNDQTKSTRTPADTVEEESSELERLGEKAKLAISSVIDIAAPVAESATSVLPSLSWSDINTAVFKGMDARDSSDITGKDGKNGKSKDDNGGRKASESDSSEHVDKEKAKHDLNQITNANKASSKTTNNNTDALKMLGNVAGWIVKRIPLPTSNNKHLKSSIDPAYPLDEVATPAKQRVIANASNTPDKATTTSSLPKSPVTNAARLLFGSTSSKSSTKSQNGESSKFDRERFYVALCKKLYDEGM